MARRGTDHNLSERLTSGRYVIDEHAVAEAMLERLVRGSLPRSAMLKAGEPMNGRPVRRGEDGAPSGAGLA
jgi:hypothetical protein